METKVCVICHKEKDIEEFARHHTYADGRKPDCKSCSQERGAKIEALRTRVFNPPDKAICNKCNIEKDINEFAKSSDRTRGFRQPCKECLQKKRRDGRKENPKWYEINKKGKLRRKYGITLDEFKEMKIIQNNQCGICGVSFDEAEFNKNFPNVDHNHETGKTRGILCTQCNSGMGFFNDNIELLEKAINYLKRYNG